MERDQTALLDLLVRVRGGEAGPMNRRHLRAEILTIGELTREPNHARWDELEVRRTAVAVTSMEAGRRTIENVLTVAPGKMGLDRWARGHALARP